MTQRAVPQQEIADVLWDSPDARKEFEEGPHCHILQVGVAAEHMGKGGGRAIYRRLREHFPGAILSAFIAVAPVENSRSLEFHLKQGFQQVGIFDKPEYHGLRDYRSVLVVDFSRKKA